MKAQTENLEVIDLTLERTLKEKLQRQLLEIEIALERGDMELVEPLEARYTTKVMATRAEYLTMPEKIRHLLHTEYGIDINADYLDEVIYKTLTTLANLKPPVHLLMEKEQAP